MVIFTGRFTAFGRLIGAVTAETNAFATFLLFGRIHQSKQARLPIRP